MTMVQVDVSTDQALHNTLKELRLSIIGDEEEKLALLKSSSMDTLFILLDQLVSGSRDGSTTLQNLLIIFYSLSRLPEALPPLVSQYNFFTALIRVANKFKDDDAVLVSVLDILSNILSTRKDFNLDLMSSDGILFNHLVFERLSQALESDQVWITKQSKVLLSIFSLIPHLNSSDMKNLIPPTLNILDISLQKALDSLLVSYPRGKIYTECFDNVYVPQPPKMLLFPKFTAPMLFSMAHLLAYDSDSDLRLSGLKVDSVLGKDHYFVISSLLKTSNPELKLAAVSILVNYSFNSDLSSHQKNINVQKLLPYLLQLIQVDDPTNIVVYRSQLNISRKFNPLDILSKLSLNFDFVNDFLLNCSVISKFCEMVNKIAKTPLDNLALTKLDNMGSVFLILSSLTAVKESNRTAILSDDMIHAIEKVLELHTTQLKQYLESPGSIDDDLLLTSNHLAASACNLLRSLSRSVATLRTHLKETQTITFLLETIAIPEQDLVNAFVNNSALLQNELLLKTVTLAIISNVVLDFSPLRKALINGGLVDSIAALLHNTENVNILLNSLWVFRHIIYNEKVDARERYMGPVGLDRLVELCDHPSHDVQEMSFNVLRNLSTSSDLHVRQLLNFFNKEKSTDEDKRQSWLNFLLGKMEDNSMHDSKNEDMLESIVYIVVHISATSEDLRDLIVRNRRLMLHIKDLLLNCQSNSIRLACVWVIINLTWVDNIQQRSGERAHVFGLRSDVEVEDNSDANVDVDADADVDADTGDDNDVVGERISGSNRLRDLRALRNRASGRNTIGHGVDDRVSKLTEMGFLDVLGSLSRSVDNLDLKERLKVAVSNLNSANRGSAIRF
ncbi:CYFA0S01e05776g1_1 [Cyberlindnera fabianii]|uniref:CYFA0S01e05776g1_1 n=1 Tax=Cyberlindnera fabianii TaxID=36022 RepID=A0A061AHC0_CYBFA|nr:CYFA0S01e05776g1_1 [Cyberlindnera fabianii]